MRERSFPSPVMCPMLPGGMARTRHLVDAYLMACCALLLLGGRFGHTTAHGRILLVGVGVFTAAAVACGIARTRGVLIRARDEPSLDR